MIFSIGGHRREADPSGGRGRHDAAALLCINNHIYYKVHYNMLHFQEELGEGREGEVKGEGGKERERERGGALVWLRCAVLCVECRTGYL